MAKETTTIKPVVPVLVGNENRPSSGVNLHLHLNERILGSQFIEIPLTKETIQIRPFDGYVLINYKWKDKRGEERDEDTAFFGVRGLHWSDICLDHTVLKKFIDELLALHGREQGLIILSYSYKTFRSLTIDRKGEEYKIKNNKRAECLINREKVKDTQSTALKIFPFLEKRWFPVKPERSFGVIQSYLINHT